MDPDEVDKVERVQSWWWVMVHSNDDEWIQSGEVKMDRVGVDRTQDGRAGSDGVGYTRDEGVLDLDSVDHMQHGRAMAALNHMELVLDERDMAKTMILWVGDTVHLDVVEDIRDREGTARARARARGVLERNGAMDRNAPAEEVAGYSMDDSEERIPGKMGGVAEAGEEESHLGDLSWAF